MVLGVGEVMEVRGEHRGGVVHLVRHAGRELPERRELLGAVQRLLGAAELRRALLHLDLEVFPQRLVGAGVLDEARRERVAHRRDGQEEGDVDEVGRRVETGDDEHVVHAHEHEQHERDELDAGVRDAAAPRPPEARDGDGEDAKDERVSDVPGGRREGAPVHESERLERVNADGRGEERVRHERRDPDEREEPDEGELEPHARSDRR